MRLRYRTSAARSSARCGGRGELGWLLAGREASGRHGIDGLGVLRDGVPDETAAEVFGHEQADADVEAEDVGVVPELVGVEGVAGAVAAPGVLAVLLLER